MNEVEDEMLPRTCIHFGFGEKTWRKTLYTHTHKKTGQTRVIC